MNISESFKIAVKAIKANWMRSLLTMLGIIIGISSVIMIVGAGTDNDTQHRQERAHPVRLYGFDSDFKAF